MALVSVTTVPLFLAALVTAGLFALTAQYREKKGAYTMLALFGSIAIWCVAYALQLGTGDVVWNRVRFVGIAAAPVAVFVFALQFTGRNDLVTPRNVALLSVMPVLTNVVIWTNGAHGLFGTFTASGVETGIWFWIHAVYSYLLALGAIALFVRHWLRLGTSAETLQRTRAFLLATLFPALGSFLTVSGLAASFGIGFDLGPYGFALSGMFISAAIFYY